MGNKINLQKNEDDTYTINEQDLLWLLGCAKDILEEDVVMHQNLPSRHLVESNLAKVKDAIEYIEK
jgi:hypothetical protein